MCYVVVEDIGDTREIITCTVSLSLATKKVRELNEKYANYLSKAGALEEQINTNADLAEEGTISWPEYDRRVVALQRCYGWDEKYEEGYKVGVLEITEL